MTNFSGDWVDFVPDRLVRPYAWGEHIPFQAWLIERLRPQLLVELGTRTGNSYGTACQVVSALGLQTVCRAIAPVHEGMPGEASGGEGPGTVTVSPEFVAYHEARYGSFSRLVRSTGPDEWGTVEDGTVDLLQIEGTEGALAERTINNWPAWFSKLAARGGVLFHGICLPDQGQGIARVWRELSPQHPSLEFTQGHGLGVLFPKGVPEVLAEAISPRDSGAATAFLNPFAALGRAILLARTQAELVAETRQLQSEKEALSERVGQLESRCGVLELRQSVIEIQRAVVTGHAAGLEESLRISSAALLKQAQTFAGIRKRLLTRQPLLKVFQSTAGLVCRVYRRNQRTWLGRKLLQAPQWSGVEACMTRAQEAAERGLAHRACELYHEAARTGVDILKNLRQNPVARAVLRGHLVSSLNEQLDAQARFLRDYTRTIKGLAEGGRHAPQPDAEAVWGMDLAFYSAQAGCHFIDAGEAAFHYAESGFRLGLNPHPLFDTRYFLERHAGRMEGADDPLAAYRKLLEKGAAPEAHPGFSGQWLREWFFETTDRELCAGVRPVPAAPVAADRAAEFSRLKPVLAVGVILFHTPAADLARMLRVIDRAAQMAVRAGHEQPRIVLTDNSHEWVGPSIQELADGLTTPVHFFPTEENIGFGAGHNHLMRGAFETLQGTHYLCLNPDGQLHPHALVELLAASARQPLPAMVEALQTPSEHPKDYDIGRLETPWNAAGCLLIPRHLFELTGGFDERFFMYCEDVDLSWRVWELGYACVVAPRALFHHHMAARMHDPKVDQWFMESGRLLAEKWGCKRFRLTCERHLVDRGYHASTDALPPLPPGRTHLPHRWVDFGNQFTFARPRW